MGDRVAFFFKAPEYDKELLNWKEMKTDEILSSLETSSGILDKIRENNPNHKDLERLFFDEIKRLDNKDKGRLLWPLRVALTGMKASPSPFEIIEILGKEEAVRRIKKTVQNLA